MVLYISRWAVVKMGLSVLLVQGSSIISPRRSLLNKWHQTHTTLPSTNRTSFDSQARVILFVEIYFQSQQKQKDRYLSMQRRKALTTKSALKLLVFLHRVVYCYMKLVTSTWNPEIIFYKTNTNYMRLNIRRHWAGEKKNIFSAYMISSHSLFLLIKFTLQVMQ